MWVLIGGMIVYCVKDIRIEKEYNKLIEENVNSSVIKKEEEGMEETTNEEMVAKE